MTELNSHIIRLRYHRLSWQRLILHRLLHIADTELAMGPAPNYWAYTLEKRVSTLRNQIHCRKYPYSNLVNRLLVYEKLRQLEWKFDIQLQREEVAQRQGSRTYTTDQKVLLSVSFKRHRLSDEEIMAVAYLFQRKYTSAGEVLLIFQPLLFRYCHTHDSLARHRQRSRFLVQDKAIERTINWIHQICKSTHRSEDR